MEVSLGRYGSSWATVVAPVGDGIKEKCILKTAGCPRAAAETPPWPLGPHVAGYKYKAKTKND